MEASVSVKSIECEWSPNFLLKASGKIGWPKSAAGSKVPLGAVVLPAVFPGLAEEFAGELEDGDWAALVGRWKPSCLTLGLGGKDC
jgi:hypothetical protein